MANGIYSTTGEGQQQNSVAVEFLQKLRPPPWLLVAISTDKVTVGRTVQNAKEAENFIGLHNGKRNLYYSLNPVRGIMHKKPTKKDISAIEYQHADLDPSDDETPEVAKARYLGQLNNGFDPKPTVVVDSGNGIQCLWRLAQPIALGNGADVIAEVEARNEALMERLGSKAGTQNIDRILRLPGTINLPDEVKRKRGRVECPSVLLAFNEASYALNAFPSQVAEEINRPGTPDDGGHHARQPDDEEDDKLEWTIRTGGEYRDIGKRSHGVWYVVNEMLRCGYMPKVVVATLLDRNNKISEHVYDQANPFEYAEKQVAAAKKEATFDINKQGFPYPSQTNVRIALLKLGVTLRYDEFADRTLLDRLPKFGPVLDDAALDRIWLIFDRRFKLFVKKDYLRTVATDTARLNKFHPVRDYLSSLQWDGVKRIDTWLPTYGGAEDNEYTRAVGELFPTAAVRRVRTPGCKFDEMVVLEIEVQGTDKSTALATIAVREEWFSDDLPLNIETKQVIELTRGRWIIEAGELSGMKRAEIGKLKSFLSRQIDRARMAFGRLVCEAPRQFVVVGTTNDLEYLRDTTGNRRVWPVRCEQFDTEALRRDRDQLWAEAAAREATGVSIRLPKRLWSMAGQQQAQRLTVDPWLEALKEAGLGDDKPGKISMGTIWLILDVRGGQQGQDQSRRVGEAMRSLGWRRPNMARNVNIGGELVSGYVRGEKPWKPVLAWRDKDGRVTVEWN
jgi:hypothetical protein